MVPWTIMLPSLFPRSHITAPEPNTTAHWRGMTEPEGLTRGEKRDRALPGERGYMNERSFAALPTFQGKPYHSARVTPLRDGSYKVVLLNAKGQPMSKQLASKISDKDAKGFISWNMQLISDDVREKSSADRRSDEVLAPGFHSPEAADDTYLPRNLQIKAEPTDPDNPWTKRWV